MAEDQWTTLIVLIYMYLCKYIVYSIRKCQDCQKRQLESFRQIHWHSLWRERHNRGSQDWTVLAGEVKNCGTGFYQLFSSIVIHSFIHFWRAPLWVWSAKRRHQSPEWAILSHVSCFIQAEIHWFQVLLGSLHPCSMGVSWWSPPVLQGEAALLTFF